MASKGMAGSKDAHHRSSHDSHAHHTNVKTHICVTSTVYENTAAAATSRRIPFTLHVMYTACTHNVAGFTCTVFQVNANLHHISRGIAWTA